MTDASQPRMARGTMLPAGFLAAALFALLVFAPFAAAAPDPLASGSTTVTLNQGFVKSLKNKGVKIQKISPAKLKGTKATFTVTGGALDPTTGLGNVTLGGGLKFKAGKKTAPVKALELDTNKKSLTAKVAGKRMKLATVAGWTYVRNGFGVNLTIKKLKLTGSAANQLNKKLGYTGNKKGGKGKSSAAASKAASPPFKGGRLIGSASSETQPSTVTVLPGGNATLNTSLATVKKLADVGVTIETVPPTTLSAEGPPPSYSFPVTGGTIAPTATAGVVQTGGGLALFQKLGPAESKISLNAIYIDLSAKTATVEIVAESNVETEPGKKPLNLGNIGRSSIADISLTGATVTADPVTHTVSVQNATATLQPVTAEVLNGFVAIYEGVTKDTGKEKFGGGDPLGTFSFTAQTQ